MAKVFRVLSLLMATSMLLWIVGCGDNDEDCASDNVAPLVTLSPSGGDILTNRIITATCSKVVDSLTVSGGVVATSFNNKVWWFSLPAGSHSITVDCTDGCGDSGSAIAFFNVVGIICYGLELDGDACDPKDGAEDVDPANVSEIIIVFSEPLMGVEVTIFEPEANIDYAIDDNTVTISFLDGFSLGNEQEVVVELSVEDLAGNTAEIIYLFTTKAKE